MLILESLAALAECAEQIVDRLSLNAHELLKTFQRIVASRKSPHLPLYRDRSMVLIGIGLDRLETKRQSFAVVVDNSKRGYDRFGW